MTIARIEGGLGNQMFIYAAARAGIAHGEDVEAGCNQRIQCGPLWTPLSASLVQHTCARDECRGRGGIQSRFRKF